eukprot:m51a1_g14245 Plasma Membrane Syntaxin D (1175) ;mRNA; f:247478-252218
MSVCLALTEASEARAFGSYNVSIVLFDDLGLDSLSPVAAGLFSRIPVVAVIGGDSSRVSMALLDGNATHPGLTASGIPLISSQAMSPLLSDRAKYPRFIRVCTSTALTSLAMVQMFSKYGITRIAGIGNNDSYGQSGLQKLVTYAARATPPIDVPATIYYPPTMTEPAAFGSYLERLTAAGAETFVVYCATMTCAPLLEQARAMGMLQKPHAWVLGNGITTYPTRAVVAQSYPKLAEAIANNTIIMGVSTAVERNLVTEKFSAEMAQYMKTDTVISPFYTYFEYDAALAWVHAVRKIVAEGGDPYNRSLLYSTLLTLEYMGATGDISFDENGDRFETNTIFAWVPGSDNLAVVGNWTMSNGVVIDPHYIEAGQHSCCIDPAELEMEKELGQGSYGAVYQAQWRGTEVVAKVIPFSKNVDIDEEKLLQEVTIMRSLRHPSLLLFMCYAKTNEALTIVTEYMPRGSLLDVLSDRAMPLSTALKLRILGDVAAGMAYLHGSSPPIIHRDLKSSNILLSESMQAKVSDFGLTVIAHMHGSAAAQSDDTVLGSLLWSAPEILSSGVFSTKSDVYAFGIVLWEMVTRELPYGDMCPVLASSFAAEMNSRPKVGPEFESVQPLRELMERCWDASPDARPEFADILGSLNKAAELLKDLIGAMAIVFTDIQQSTELWEWNAQLMKEALYQHHYAIRAALRRYKGYEVETQGDAFMITFQATIDALRFCADAQLALVNLRWNPGLLEFPTCRCIMNGETVQFKGLRVRMGIHYGEPEVQSSNAGVASTERTNGDLCASDAGNSAETTVDYIGPCVIKAMRVASAASGGQIVLSSAAAQEVERDPEALLQLGKLLRVGVVQLKGFAQSEEIFEFAVGGLERHFEGVPASPASNLLHPTSGDAHDLYERFMRSELPTWAITARDVETTREVAERGNFGVVFKGMWKGQTVAVKKFFRQKVDCVTVAEIEHQIKEIALLSDIRHPNIVLFLGACTEPHSMFIVTEWMDMGNLLQLIASSSQIDRRHGVAILVSTSSALTYLHQCGVVHRDLMSSNILLSKNMDVKVSDFGLAAVKTANKISTLCGSVAWMAPEVLSSSTYTEASDVYSFGIIMNEVLTCEVPFKGLNKVVVSRQVLQGRRPDIPRKLGAYTNEYVDLMCRCWDQQSSQRPTFKTICAELTAMCDLV